MDNIEISLRQKRNKIYFECTPGEENLIVNAWMEVVSKINALAKSLAKPDRSNDIENLLPEKEEKVDTDSTASRFVRGYLMIPHFKASSKKEAIEKIVDAIAQAFPKNVINAQLCKQAVFEREESMATGLDHGIAVPHGRTDGVNHIVGAVAIVDNSENENGIIPDYETIDHSCIQFIVLTLVPNEANTPYLQLMAFINRIMRSSENQKKLLECKTEEQMKKIFNSIN